MKQHLSLLSWSVLAEPGPERQSDWIRFLLCFLKRANEIKLEGRALNATFAKAGLSAHCQSYSFAQG